MEFSRPGQVAWQPVSRRRTVIVQNGYARPRCWCGGQSLQGVSQCMYVYVFTLVKNISQGQCKIAEDPPRRILGKWRALNLKLHSFHSTSACVQVPSQRAPHASYDLTWLNIGKRHQTWVLCWGRVGRKNQTCWSPSPKRTPGRNETWLQLQGKDKEREPSQTSGGSSVSSVGCAVRMLSWLRVFLTSFIKGDCGHYW